MDELGWHTYAFKFASRSNLFPQVYYLKSNFFPGTAYIYDEALVGPQDTMGSGVIGLTIYTGSWPGSLPVVPDH